MGWHTRTVRGPYGSYPPPPPPLHTERSHPRGNIPQNTPSDSSLAPSKETPMQRTRDMKQDVQTQRHMNNKMSREPPVGMHVQLH